jgi:tRNA-dihydrouridine synthase C
VLFDALRRETDCERISQMLGIVEQEAA